MRHLLTFLLATALMTGVRASAQEGAADRETTDRASADQASTDAPAQDAPKVEMNELERKFERTMSGATLVGRFTVTGRGDDGKPPAEERYEISKVTKIGPDQWLFVARIGEAKFPVPLPLPVKWAGDTPVISVTKVKVPGMGTYTARVLIYDDHYAGTWDAGDHGGHLWGRIERAGEKPAAAGGEAEKPGEAEPAPAPNAK